MAFSENVKRITAYLKANEGKQVTSAELAAAIGITRTSVDGAFTSLVNKGYAKRVTTEIDGTKDIKFVICTGDATDDMSDVMKTVINYVKAATDNITPDDVAEGTGLAATKIRGIILSGIKKGVLNYKTAKIAAPVTVKFLVLTDEGKAVDYDVE